MDAKQRFLQTRDPVHLQKNLTKKQKQWGVLDSLTPSPSWSVLAQQWYWHIRATLGLVAEAQNPGSCNAHSPCRHTRLGSGGGIWDPPQASSSLGISPQGSMHHGRPGRETGGHNGTWNRWGSSEAIAGSALEVRSCAGLADGGAGQKQHQACLGHLKRWRGLLTLSRPRIKGQEPCRAGQHQGGGGAI